MKKVLISLLVIVGLFSAVAVTGAAPAEAGKIGPYEGVFHGTVYAPNGSKAPLSLDLTHRGSAVEGTVYIGNGLSIDAGICGSAALPASTVFASGQTSASNPRYLEARSSFNVSDIQVTVDLESIVQGDKLSTEAKIDLPWICGGDPVLTGTLFR